MNRNLIKKLILISLIAIVVLLPLGQEVAAQSVVGSAVASLFGSTAKDIVISWVAQVVNLALTVVSFFVVLTGTLLNVSINITINIRDFVNSIPAIYEVWRTIRDVSGMILIFFLLYASIQLITGIKRPDFGGLIKGIVMAGILINFSFFIAGVMIDASNVVSLALYRAIVPGQPEAGAIITSVGTRQCQGRLPGIVCALYNDGGISAVFMQTLQIQTQFAPENLNLKNEQSAPGAILRTIILGVTGIIISITVALSFLAASLAFIARLFILIFLLAFSPLWFAAVLIPQLQTWTKKGWDLFKAQLIFMPAYLLLMYAAILILTRSDFFKVGGATNIWQGAETGIPINFIILAVNVVFVIFMLNVPLLAAFALGAKAPAFLSADKIGAANIWKRLGGYTATQTAGRLGAMADKSFGNTSIGNSAAGRAFRGATFGNLAKSKMGSGKSFEDRAKEGKDIARKDREIGRREQLSILLDNARRGGPPPLPGKPNLKDVLKGMSEKERLALGKDNLKNPSVLRYLGKGDFEAIKKMDDGDMGVEDKREISVARKKTIEDAIKGRTVPENAAIVKEMLKAYEGKDVLDIDENLLDDTILVRNYTISQVKGIFDHTTNAELKKKVADEAINEFIMFKNKVPSYGWLKEWREKNT